MTAPAEELELTGDVIAYAFEELTRIQGPNLTEEVRQALDGTEMWLHSRLAPGRAA